MTNTEIAAASKIMLGTTEAIAMYIGSTLIWQQGSSGGEQTHDYSKDYFTIESLVDNNSVKIQNVSCNQLPVFYYSTDDGQNWSSITAVKGSTQTVTTINNGDKIIFKCSINKLGTAWNQYNKFTCSGNFKVYGNIMSLLYGDNFVSNTEFSSGSTCNFAALFYQTTTLIDASDLILPAITGTVSCYNCMFRGTTNLAHGPKELPATTINQDSYSSMFEGCINLEEAPIIKATTLNGTMAMGRMFCMNRNNKLTTPKLTKGPVLLSTTLAETCYKEMFKGNGNLVEVTCLAIDMTASNRTQDWLTNCSSTGTFYKNPNATTWGSGNSGIPSGWTTIDYSN